MIDLRFIRSLPRPVIFLGIASLTNDIASEAIYAVLPFFLTDQLGASLVFIGFLEGFVQIFLSVMKVLTGYISDRSWQRDRFVFLGYFLSCIARPLFAFCLLPWHVLTLRMTDRLGKGIRASPKEAMLGSFAAPENRGQVYGFDRGMDNLGASVGPILAAAFLYFYPSNYRGLFLLTLIPGILTLLAIKKIQTPIETSAGGETKPKLKISWKDFKDAPPAYKHFLLLIFFFYLSFSADAFILLRLKDGGLATYWIPIVWAALNVVKTLASFWGGKFSDTYGRKISLVLAFLIYAVTYFGLGYVHSYWPMILLLLIYGFYYGLAETAERALIVDLIPAHFRGTAFGCYYLAAGIGSFIATLAFGYLWQKFSPSVAFYFGASIALASALILYLVQLGPQRKLTS